MRGSVRMTRVPDIEWGPGRSTVNGHWARIPVCGKLGFPQPPACPHLHQVPLQYPHSGPHLLRQRHHHGLINLLQNRLRAQRGRFRSPWRCLRPFSRRCCRWASSSFIIIITAIVRATAAVDCWGRLLCGVARCDFRPCSALALEHTQGGQLARCHLVQPGGEVWYGKCGRRRDRSKFTVDNFFPIPSSPGKQNLVPHFNHVTLHT